ncbi:MAG: insulinase family protein [Sphingobacteriales bacterium]|nr:MAG: insulinase family protein [Sphingobacteriales bacterium]
MIQYERFVLTNGLRVLVHEDTATPMAVVNVMYDVGARDESPDKTGFAHLFEHLMFGGSINIESYDDPLQLAGGENNAYTTNDLTNYYCQLPAENLETAFWLESDRMLSLAFNEKSLEVQRKVVCEEFKEHYINKPYGDVWFKMREMAYTQHPYRWLTIGKELSHIENATLKDVKDFFFKHYRPVNAILVVAGNVKTEQVRKLAEKWFGDIPMGEKYNRNIVAEPVQTIARVQEVKAKVPLDAIYKCWHMDDRLSEGYYAAELITEVLSGGGSSRLFQALVKEQKLFSSIDCYHFGTTDNGLMTIEGKLVKGVSMQAANDAIEQELDKLKQHLITEKELQKIINKTEVALAFEDISVMNRANSLAFYELLGNANLMNEEFEKYQVLTKEKIQQYASQIFTAENSNTLFYLSEN